MFKHRPFLRALLIFVECWIVGVVAILILYFSWYRDWQLNWGATDEEIGRYMAGDELLLNPSFNATRAVEIKASPEEIWPWLVQMGYKRGGFYAFDNLDNAGIPSADSIIPEYQDLKVGDSLTFYRVVEMVPKESMLWVFHEGMGGWAGATWSWGIYRIDNERTKLVSRLRKDFSRDKPQEKVMFTLMEATEIFMMRTCLLGIRHRAEGD